MGGGQIFSENVYFQKKLLFLSIPVILSIFTIFFHFFLVIYDPPRSQFFTRYEGWRWAIMATIDSKLSKATAPRAKEVVGRVSTLSWSHHIGLRL